MNFILILTIIVAGSYGPQVSTTTAEFATFEACAEAGRLVGKDVSNNEPFRRYSVYYSCVPKGTQ